MKNLIIIILLFSSESINACLCGPLTLDKEIERSNFIFSGRVILQSDEYDLVVIATVWKGELKDTIKLYHGTESCYRRRLEINKDFLIFLENQRIGIYNCSRTTELALSQDIDKLNEIFKGIKSKKKNHLTENEFRFIKNVFINSELQSLLKMDDSCTFFVCSNSNKDYKILTFQEFIKYDHFGRVPLLMKLDSKNGNITLFAFSYFTVDFIKPKKALRELNKQLKHTSCNIL